MLRSEAVASIQRHLSFRKDLESEALAELRQAQSKFEREGIPAPGVDTAGTFLPWFLQTEIAKVTVEANEERIPLPIDFLAEVEDSGLWLFNSNGADADEQWKPVTKAPFKRVRRTTGEHAMFYTRSGIYFRIFPTVPTVSEFRMLYYATDTVLGDVDIENKWLKYAPDLLIGEAGWHLAIALKYREAISVFENMKAVAARRLFFASEDAEISNLRLAMGGIED